MVRIRLRRVGARKQPSFRVVAADRESPRDGRFLEILGHYNPRTEPSTIHFEEDRVYHWLSVGAQPSESVRQLFDQVGLSERYQRYQEGEDLEALLEEATATEEARQVDPRTQVVSPSKPAEEAEKPPEPEEEAEETKATVETEEAEQVEQAEAEVEEAEGADESEEVEETDE